MKVEILLVSSSPTEAHQIKEILADYDVKIFYNYNEAINEKESNENISLLVLDIDNQNKIKSNILDKARNDKNIMETIIITEKEERGKYLDKYDCITKPIDPKIIRTRIEMHIELIKARHIIQQEVYEKDVIFDAVFNQIPIGISISYTAEAIDGLNNQFFRCNPAFEKITGRSKDDLSKLGWSGITHPDDVEANLIAIDRLKKGEIDTYTLDKRYIRPDGSIVWVHLLGTRLDLADNNPYNYMAIIQDVSERKMMENALQESERSKSVLLSHLPGMAYRCKFDREWTMEYISEGCLELTGYPIETLLDNSKMSFNDLMAPEYREVLWGEWNRILPKGLKLKYEYEIITATGERKWVLEMGQGIYDSKGNVEALEGIIIDISDRKAMENTLKYNSENDSRTGLKNRSYLEKILNNDRLQENQGKRALIGINLSTIHSLTSLYGFNYTLEIICNIAEALKKISTPNNTLYMTYENRFVFYKKDYEDKKNLVEFTGNIKKALESVLAVERIGGSIGIIEIEDYQQLEANILFKNLMIASENAVINDDSEYGVCFYDKDLEEKVEKEKYLKQELSDIAYSVDDGGLFLQYQPIYNLKNKKIYGFEALARLNSKKYGLVPPLEFIPLAEKNKLIVAIGNKVIRQALGFLKRLNNQGYQDLCVSINVSVIQFMKNDFISNLFDTIKEMEVNSRNIGIEITESLVAINFNSINNVLGQLRDAGISVYIDDFGTGYSSLARENELNVNFLKIDKSFIDSLLIIKLDESITGDIVSLAHRLGHRVVAEGVEDIRQMDYLEECGCDMVQGYYVSRPLDEDVAYRFLENKILDI